MKSEKNVSVLAHHKSWVAGVLDAGLRVTVDRTYHPQAMRMRVRVLGYEELLEELQGTLGGSIGKDGLVLRQEEVVAVWYEYGPLMRTRRRDMLRIAAAWAALPRAWGKEKEQVLDMRVKLWEELKAVRGKRGSEEVKDA